MFSYLLDCDYKNDYILSRNFHVFLYDNCYVEKNCNFPGKIYNIPRLNGQFLFVHYFDEGLIR